MFPLKLTCTLLPVSTPLTLVHLPLNLKGLIFTGNKHKALNLFLAGLVISFLGALPFGTLNLTAFKISVSGAPADALWFAFGAILVELLMVRLTLLRQFRIRLNRKWMLFILPSTILLLSFLAWNSFSSQGDSSAGTESFFNFSELRSAFLFGILLSFFNPLQIPFWMVWNTVLKQKKLLSNTRFKNFLYLGGIGLGTFIVFLLFIFAGSLIMEYYEPYSKWIGYFMGSLYLIFAGMLLVRLYNYCFTPALPH